MSSLTRNISSELKNVYSSILLARAPIVSRDLNEFEEAYYKYQTELEKRLMWTFPSYFYFKKGSLSERNFVKANKGPVSRVPDVFYPKGVPEIRHNRERRSKQELVIPTQKSMVPGAQDSFTDEIRANPRTTEADEKNDTRSLERKLSRTLYLVVNSGGVWKLPTFAVTDATQPLHVQTVQHTQQMCPHRLNIQTVSHYPVAVLRPADRREYVVLSHLIAGRFALADEYAWLAREELASRVEPAYFASIGHLLSAV
ncbi:mitochondrial 54S ribosomal protein mL46 ASCRUDRAFT_79185 [Ascoidea rubescens DSM 1968]|uniref:Large ribosomal subunit protein mL46 n=1 Tax=Ascoidea rubescens DSM 1968 TaxID=1344418 RepID=A0A1D2VRY8_9ASCO|nr:hypothetical protein ASCRUDRAFT_79185 [Ascoidea rubescens DSM 1968]ODV64325.1 hypothetical protein ASCRUDRAFT_79185 [Ascoidea rubescens DSM 1968]